MRTAILREFERTFEDVDLLRLSAEIVVDAVVQPEELRREMIHRLRYAERKDRRFSERRHGIPPV